MTALSLLGSLALAALGFCGGITLAWTTRMPEERPEGWAFFLGCLGIWLGLRAGGLL